MRVDPVWSPSSLGLVLVLAVLTGCEAPPVFPGADKQQNASGGRIEGQLVASSVARGKTVVLLYDAARPPPPTGTGRPVAFTVVPSESLFGAALPGDLGPFTAPFAFSLVAPGAYLVRAFIDANDDFVPWYGVTSDVNAGDVAGAAIDAATRAARVVPVSVQAGQPVPTLDVPVTLSDALRVPVDRPVFELDGATGPVTLGASESIHALRATPIVEGAVRQAQPVFLVRLIDDDGNGVPDDANGDGVPELWPRALVRKLADGDNLLADETGVDYEHQDPSTGARLPADGAPDVVVLAAAIDPTDLWPQLVDGEGRPKSTPTAVTALKLVVKPVALDLSSPSRPGLVRGVPRGRYAVVLVQSTGQTWRLPNELAPPMAAAGGLPSVESQGAFFLVP
jgi:hypothetical protein